MVKFHTDSKAYERNFVAPIVVKFPSRRYSPDEKRIVIIILVILVRPWNFSKGFSFQREGEEMKNVTQETSVTNNVTSVDTPVKTTKMKFFTAGNMAVMSILTAISFILYAFVKFPLPFIFPSFLDIQISDMPALLVGFALGPVAGCIIIVVKCCLKMLFGMSGTACVGELADIIVGIAFVLPASLFYKYNKNRKGAIWGMVLGTASAIVASLLSNWLILIPFYAKAYGMEAIIGMVNSLYPEVTAETFYNYYLPLAVLPFNLLRCAVCAVITYFVYKPLSKALHWEIKRKKKSPNEEVA